MEIPPFYISSRGHSATAWVAAMFSSHPDIVCFHGTRSVPPYSSGRGHDMDPESFIDALQICSSSSHGKSFGAVHGFYGTACKEPVERRGGRFAAIIRHPVKRIHSCFLFSYARKIMGEEASTPVGLDFYRFIHSRGMDRVLRRVDEAGDIKVSNVEQAFFHICESLIFYDLECLREAGREANFRMEDIVSSSEAFLRLFEYMTQGKVDYDKDFVEKIHQSKKMNTHTAPATDEEIYESWPKSFQYLFHLAVESNGGVSVYEAYKSMQYDLPCRATSDFDLDSF